MGIAHRPFARIVLAFAWAIGAGAGAGAQRGEALAALARASIFGDYHFLTLSMTMTISEGNSSRERGLSIKSVRSGEAERTLAAIVSPVFLNKLAFLRVKDAEGSRQWLRTSSSVARVAEGNRNERLFGSDFTVSDFLDASSGARSAVFEASDEADLVVVRAATADGDRIVSFGSTDGIVRRVEYLAADGSARKRYRVLELSEGKGPRYPTKAIMEDLRSGGSTRIAVKAADFATPIADRAFNPAAL